MSVEKLRRAGWGVVATCHGVFVLQLLMLLGDKIGLSPDSDYSSARDAWAVFCLVAALVVGRLSYERLTRS